MDLIATVKRAPAYLKKRWVLWEQQRRLEQLTDEELRLLSERAGRVAATMVTPGWKDLQEAWEAKDRQLSTEVLQSPLELSVVSKRIGVVEGFREKLYAADDMVREGHDAELILRTRIRERKPGKPAKSD